MEQEATIAGVHTCVSRSLLVEQEATIAGVHTCVRGSLLVEQEATISGEQLRVIVLFKSTPEIEIQCLMLLLL